MDQDTPAWIAVIGFVAAGVAAIWLTYATILAFVGGTLWPFGTEFGGSFGFGLTWLFVGDPIAATVLYWAFMLVMIPLILVDAGLRRVFRRGSQGATESD